MADLTTSPGAEGRASETLLRSSGGRAVKLRLPTPATPGDSTEQLGLATPQFQEVELAPVVVLAANAKGTRQLLVSAKAVNALVGSLSYSSASILFGMAAGVLLDDMPMEILSMTENESRGVPYLYRLTLQTPAVTTI